MGEAISTRTPVTVKVLLAAIFGIGGIATAYGVLTHKVSANGAAIEKNVKVIQEIQEDTTEKFFQQQRSIDTTVAHNGAVLAEMKHNREEIKEHCDEDVIRDAGDVRDVMRGVP